MNYITNNWFALLMVSMGIFAILIGLKTQQRLASAAEWPSVSGVVVDAKIITKTKRGRPRSTGFRIKHLPQITFEYSIGTEKLTNRQKYFGSKSPSRLLKKYAVGTPVAVTFNPHDPSDSFLEASGADSVGPAIGLGVFFLILGFALMFGPALLPRNQIRKGSVQPDALKSVA